jgi:hypothetical protein
LTGWIAPGSGFLVYDINSDGIIYNGAELFGNNTLLKNGQYAANGFEALADWDDNKDGIINSDDAIWSLLMIWCDIDGSGFELYSLSDFDIVGIYTGYTSSDYVDPNGNEHRQIGSFIRSDGSTGTAVDVWFQTDPTYTIATEWLEIFPDIEELPDLTGYGTVYSLHQVGLQ